MKRERLQEVAELARTNTRQRVYIAPEISVGISREQLKRASYLQAILKSALLDPQHPAWASIIDPAWLGAERTQTARIEQALDVLTEIRDAADTARESAHRVRNNLASIDRAFETLDVAFIARVLAPMLDPRQSRGEVNTLARLTVQCGALGCDPQKTVEAEANRLKKARSESQRKVK
jgi:hypothetical protein